MSKVEASRPRRRASVAKKGSSRAASAAKKRDAMEEEDGEVKLVKHHVATPKRTTVAKKEKSSKTLVWVSLLVLIVFLGMATVGLSGGRTSTTPPTSPCASQAYADTRNPIASALLSRRDRISGVHVINPDALKASLAFLKPSKCHTQIIEVSKPFSDLPTFRSFLTRAFTSVKRDTTCIVWVVDLSHVEQIGGALKELLESNSLRGEQIVPGGKRGVLILKSSLSREELKDKLPHRVVHMFRSVELPS